MRLDPIEAEKRLAQAVSTADESFIAAELAAIGRESLDFTGRCYAAAITAGLESTAVLFGRNGFCLNVMDEPAVRQIVESGTAGTRGLVGFMQRYRYCRAQRTYYLPIVQQSLSTEPIRALLAEGSGLTERDKTELLSLSVRQDNVGLARVLVEGGAQLYDDIRLAAPDDLQANMAVGNAADPWAVQLSPRSSLPMIDFVLDQMGDGPCPVKADWFKLYFRDPQFGAKLALIAPHADEGLCEDGRALLVELSGGGHSKAVRSILHWASFSADELDEALSAAQEAGHVEVAAELLRERQARSATLDFLAF